MSPIPKVALLVALTSLLGASTVAQTEKAGAAPYQPPTIDSVVIVQEKLFGSGRAPGKSAEFFVIDDPDAASDDRMISKVGTKFMESTGNAAAIIDQARRIGQRKDIVDGVVRIPRPRRRAVLVAIDGEAFGYSTFISSQDRGVMLSPLRRALVQVVDSKGAPVEGATVAILDEFSHSVVEYAVTENGGSAVLRFHAPEYIAAISLEAGEQKQRFAVVTPSEAGGAIPIPADGRIDGIVKLTAPATGTLVVEVSAVDGELAPDGVEVRLAPIGLDGTWRRPRLKTRTQAGRAVFPCVGLGETMMLTTGRSSTDSSLPIKIRGPEVLGATAVVRVALKGRPVIVCGRIVDSSGQPLAQRWVSMFVGARTEYDRAIAFTDETGRFSVESTLECPSSRSVSGMYLLDCTFGALAIVVPVHDRKSAGPIDLGDIGVDTLPPKK